MAKLLGILVLIILGLAAWFYFMPADTASPNTVATSTTATTRTYASSSIGLSFEYPSTYTLSENRAGQGGVVLTVADTEALAAAPQNGEGPPSIAVGVYSATATSAERWIRTDQRSNFQLAATSSLATTTVDGKPAFEYESDGLYATRNIVLLHAGRIYMFSVGWLTRNDQIVDDFSQFLRTVNLQ